MLIDLLESSKAIGLCPMGMLLGSRTVIPFGIFVLKQYEIKKIQ